jgi:hypothetical protein
MGWLITVAGLYQADAAAGLSDATAQAIANDVGPREMTVRQMLHAAALRSRQPSMTAAVADHLVRMSLTESPLEGLPSSMQSAGSSNPGFAQQPDRQQQFFSRDVERGLPLESVGSTTGSACRAAAPAAVPTGDEVQQNGKKVGL